MKFTGDFFTLATFRNVPRSRYDEVVHQIPPDELKDLHLEISMFRANNESGDLGEEAILGIWPALTWIEFVQERLGRILGSYNMIPDKSFSGIVCSTLLNEAYNFQQLPPSAVLVASTYSGENAATKTYNAVLDEVGGLMPGQLVHIAHNMLSDEAFRTGFRIGQFITVWESPEAAQKGEEILRPILQKQRLSLTQVDLTIPVRKVIVRETVTTSTHS
ncbi:MAG: hypothetical protein JOZ18_23710 [Chloroflexi bacterium]|nr:hypothetical protein [Chloroflexota bacterium]